MEVNAFDQEIEYERLHAAVPWKQIPGFIFNLHSSQEHAPGCNKLRHLYAVAELSERYAREYLKERDFFEQRYYTNVCHAAGLLHEAITRGVDFEAVVAVSDEAVARTVAEVTPDLRLSRPKRIRIYSNQVGLGSEVTQLVKLADLTHNCHLLTSYRGPLIRAARDWLEEAHEVLIALGKISGSMQPHWLKLKKGLSALEKASRGANHVSRREALPPGSDG